MATLTYANGRFVFRCNFAERAIARENGFLWDTLNRVWFTTEIRVAVRLRNYADKAARLQIHRHAVVKLPWSEPLPLPFDQADQPKPYQLDAVKFALERNRCYLGLDPGLGKTLCAALIVKALKLPTVYVLPPFLIENVKAEFKRWTPHLRVNVYPNMRSNADVVLVPDSRMARDKEQEIYNAVKDWAKKGRVVVAKRMLLIVDEAHRFKASTARRTKVLFGRRGGGGSLVSLFHRHVFMSGTPMPNRPLELYPVLSSMAPESIDHRDQFNFGVRYCNGFKDRRGHWDFSGASNLQELRDRVIHPGGAFMLRIRKDVLDLPPKIEEVFILSERMSPRLSLLNQQVTKSFGTEDLMAGKLFKEGEPEHVSTYRRLLGKEKAATCVAFLKSLLDETEENLLVFAFHKDVIEALKKGLAKYDPLVITGDVPSSERHQLVTTYQADIRRRLLIANYVAGGIGFNITKANRVFFAEFDWTPGVNDQAADRAHRMGQKGTVLVQYAVYKDSIDEAVIETLLRKRKSLAYV